MRFRPEQHLRRQSDFRAIREQGGRMSCGAFTLAWRRREPAAATAEASSAPRPSPAATETIPADLRRVGVVASTAAVGGAVKRARAKRRLREVFRLHQDLVPSGCDLLLIARNAMNRAAFADLERTFADACRRIATTSSAPRA